MGNPSKKVMERRWQVAREEAERINKLLADNPGSIMVEEEGEVFTVPFTITRKEIYLQVTDSCRYGVFENNPDRDHGLYHTVSEIRKMFRGYKVYKLLG